MTSPFDDPDLPEDPKPRTRKGPRGSAVPKRLQNGGEEQPAPKRRSSSKSQKAVAPVSTERKSGSRRRPVVLDEDGNEKKPLTKKELKKRRQRFYLYPLAAVCAISMVITVMVFQCEYKKINSGSLALRYWQEKQMLPIPDVAGDKLNFTWAWLEAPRHLNRDRGHEDGIVFYAQSRAGKKVAIYEVAWYQGEHGRTFELAYARSLATSEKLYLYRRIETDTGIIYEDMIPPTINYQIQKFFRRLPDGAKPPRGWRDPEAIEEEPEG